LFLSIILAISIAMNLVFIRYFLAVAETGNFTEAAERCHVTQPTLSAGVARLEDELGSRLFDRGRRTALTAAGQRLVPHARAMVEAWQLARAEQRSSKRQRLVRIAIASTLPIRAAMGWIAAAQKRTAFDVEISEGTADAVMQRWRRGRCDLALFPTRDPAPLENAVALLREPYVLAASADHRVATRYRWSVKELSDTPFILRAACEAHEDATHLVTTAGVRPRAVLSSDDEERCAAAVLAGLGVCLMPRSLLRPGMASAEIHEVSLERRVMLAWRPDADDEIVTALRTAAIGDDRFAVAR
jgi:DNA-binding transcriptional LysR family regulator